MAFFPGAWLMAVYLKGMTDEETSYLTRAMLHSGRIFRWPESLQPLIGRALGFTGGTIDKLEAIPGFRALMSMEDVRDN
ncbi:hypothetical protein RvY_13644 [Ramazzottius varieornatus]|uniref:Glycosyl transferase family 3 N-terminal domain-containing protein n=1 Tax=Ramazzottius varieornatus TaxID=947166 RepID=A0A1D1VX40_RAMVA|nr:hypothetical protein RvY_13644 [Ramazzottius varieornatus]